MTGRRLTSDVRWGAVSVSAAVGAGICIVGGVAFSDPYLQAVAVNLGTSLLLFGYLWVAERRLTKSIDALAMPRSLGAAQEQLRDLMKNELGQESHRDDARDPVAESIRAATSKIMKAGFRQVRPRSGGDDVRLIGSCEPSIEWTIIWDGSSLRHVIRLPSGSWQGEAIAIEPASDADSQQHSLRRFEEQVFDGLCHIIDSLRERVNSRRASA